MKTKITLLVFSVSLLLACSGKQKQQDNDVVSNDFVLSPDDSTLLYTYFNNDDIKWWQDSVVAVIDFVKSCKFNSVPYNSIEAINQDFTNIVKRWQVAYPLFKKRLEYHLSNPITFEHNINGDDYFPFEIAQSPDKKYKIYSLRLDDSNATIVYIQYKNDLGQVVYKPLFENAENKSINYTDIYQFKYKNENYYVLLSYELSVGGWTTDIAYHIEVATFQNGVPTFHKKFFPKGKPCSYDENSSLICYENPFDTIRADVKYNPKTKTISYTYYHYDKNNKKIYQRESWSLVMPKE